MTDNSPSRDTSRAPSSTAIADYNGSKQYADCYDTLETNLNASVLLLS